MGRITIFTEDDCQQSVSLREYLDDNDVPYHDISLTKHPDRRLDMITLSSDLSTPHIFFNCLHIGGLSNLKHLFDIYIQEGTNANSFHEESSTSSVDDDNPSSSNNMILERLTKSVLNQSPPNHESKLRPSSPKDRKYHHEFQIEYDSWVERIKANEHFTIRHVAGEEQLSICDVTRTLLKKVPQQNHYEYPLSFHRIHTKCFRGKDLLSILKGEYSFLDSHEDILAFAQTLLDLGILHHVVHSKQSHMKCNRNVEGNFQDATITNTDRIKFNLGGIFRVQPLHAPHILNKCRLWAKMCIVDGHDPQPLMTLSRLTAKLNSAISKGLNKFGSSTSSSRQRIDYTSIRKDPNFHEFEKMTCLLQLTNLDSMLDKARLAFFINLYNLMVKHAVILQQHSLSKPSFYTKFQYMVGDYLFSLDDIYHGILRCNAQHPKTNKIMFSESDERKNFKCSSLNPRIHFALNSNYWSGEGDDVGVLTDSFEYHREAVGGELFIIAQERCKADERIIVDDHKNVLNLPNFIRWYIHDFISYWNGIDNEFPIVISKFLIGEKREILEQMIRKTSSRQSKRRISVTFSDNDNAMSIHRGLGCLPFKCPSTVKANKFGAFPQAPPEDELQLLDDDYEYFDPELITADFDDSFSQSSSYVRDNYMSSAWDSMSHGDSSWNLSLKSSETFAQYNSEPKTPNHPTAIPVGGKFSDKFPSTPSNRHEGKSHSPSGTVKTVSTTRGSPSSNDHRDCSSTTTPDEISGELVFPDFQGDGHSFGETTNNDALSEDSSACSGPPKAKRVVENKNLFVEGVGEEDSVKTTKEIINIFFPPNMTDDVKPGENDDRSNYSSDDGLSLQSQSMKHESCNSLLSNDTQFEKLFNSSMASI